MSDQQDSMVVRLKARVTELEGLLKAQKSAATLQAGQLEAALNQVNDQAAILQTIVASTATTGEEFFRSLVGSLASTLDVRCTFVGEVMSNRSGHVRTLALWIDDALAENVEYALTGTPCEQIVTQGRMQVFERGIRQKFPNDQFLAILGMESYVGVPLFSDQGEVMGLVGVIHDAPMVENSQAQLLLEVYASRIETELRRLRLSEALEESEEKYRLLFAHAMDAVTLFDTRTHQILDANGVILNMFGYSRDEFLRLRIDDLSMEPAATVAAVKQAIEVGGAHIPLHWAKKKDGTVFPIEISCGPFSWKGRTVMCGVVRDVTRRHRHESALLRTTEALQVVIQANPLAMISLDRVGNVTRWNPAAECLFGWTEEQVIGRPLPNIPPGKEQESDAVWDAAMAGQNLKGVELTRLTKTGQLIDVGLWVTPIRDDEGQVVSTLGMMVDLSERNARQRTLHALVASTGSAVGDEFFGLLASNLASALRVRWAFMGELHSVETRYSVKTRAVWADTSLGDNVEYPLEGSPCEQVIVDSQMCHYPQNVRALFPRDQGLAAWGVESYLATPVLNEEGRPIGLLGVMHDAPMPDNVWGQALLQIFASRTATELQRLRTQETLRQSQKMEAVGRISGGIAHFFNNLLTVINGYSHFLLASYGLKGQVREHVESIHEAGKRLADLTAQLLVYSQKQIVVPQFINVNALVRDQASLLKPLVGENVELRTILTPKPCPIHADLLQMEQLLMHLVVNARDAMPEGGTLTIETALVPGQLVSQASLPSQPFVRLIVRDTGIGMDENTRQHIFEPFFTTKERSTVTGLGLAVVYGIVTQNSGIIMVDSAPGQGTIVTIYLPKLAVDWIDPLGH